MSVASALVRGNLTSTDIVDRLRHPLVVATRTATIGLGVLVLVAPFEATHPLLQLPGQSLSTVEVALLIVLSSCGVAFARARAWRAISLADLLPWVAFVVAAGLSALAAPAYRGNALHMAARIGVAATLWGISTVATRDDTARRQLVIASIVSGVVIAALVIADYAGVQLVGRFLAAFRAGVAVVGVQVRASGPFQYPTIASMYLEVVFALGLGLLVARLDASPRVRLATVGALVLISEAIVLTFTRSGVLAVALSLLLVAAASYRRRARHAIGWLGVVAAVFVIEILSSQSAEMLMLRMTTEGQGRWFSAVFDVPSHIALDTRTPIDVPVTITNTGRATWDSDAVPPIRLSYHWIADDSDDVIAWQGIRTPFDEPVRPGRTVSLTAQIGGPGRPGRFRLLWDLEQEHRLWFSTEPEAELAFSEGTVTGPPTNALAGIGPRRILRMPLRPGRLILWGAALRMFLERPLIGVGPDNYRLLYGRYAPSLKEADPRVHSNNMYVEVLAGMGIVGIVALAWIGGRIVRALRIALSTEGAGVGIGAGIAAACAAIALHGLADSFLSFTGTYILIAVTLGLASGFASGDNRHAHRI